MKKSTSKRTGKVRRFNNENDGAELTADAQAALSNEALMDQLNTLINEHDVSSWTEKVKDDIDEIIRRFDHALECLARPNMYYQKDVTDFLESKSSRLHKRKPGSGAMIEGGARAKWDRTPKEDEEGEEESAEE